MPSVRDYGVVFGVAAAVTFIVTGLMRWIAPRIGAIVQPDDRRVHQRPTPTLGGVAMFLGLVAGVVTAWKMDVFDSQLAPGAESYGMLLAALIILLVGLVDDIREISPPAKVAGMVLAGSVLSFAGIGIVVFRVPFLGVTPLTPDLSALITVVWVVGMANAINLIDGLDGLAAGIVGIAAVTFFFYALRLSHEAVILPENPGALIAAITAGLCLGFLPHNFNPARIFMGDSGALMLGLLMAVSTTVVGGRNEQAFSGQSFFFYAPIFIPLVILGVPLLDALFAIVRRTARRRGVATADKDHLHHRLMRIGHGHRRSVLILWAWTMLLSGFVLYPTYNHGRGDAMVPTGIAALGLLLYTVLHPDIRQGRADRREGQDAGDKTNVVQLDPNRRTGS
jgi:UDP-GlcNAc:undecaprenyl-phosphate/decaprenyl-phosphate GlcNAc-1-phosphate transferase